MLLSALLALCERCSSSRVRLYFRVRCNLCTWRMAIGVQKKRALYLEQDEDTKNDACVTKEILRVIKGRGESAR